MGGTLKGIGAVLQAAFTCPTCGKSMLVKAIAWKGHGTGERGTSQFDAKSFEIVTTETHCTCPGGPCDQAGVGHAPP